MEFIHDQEDPEWDYCDLQDRDAFQSFQAAADYCLTCSDYSSEGDYDPTDECFLMEIVEENAST